MSERGSIGFICSKGKRPRPKAEIAELKDLPKKQKRTSGKRKRECEESESIFVEKEIPLKNMKLPIEKMPTEEIEEEELPKPVIPAQTPVQSDEVTEKKVIDMMNTYFRANLEKLFATIQKSNLQLQKQSNERGDLLQQQINLLNRKVEALEKEYASLREDIGAFRNPTFINEAAVNTEPQISLGDSCEYLWNGFEK